MNRIATWDADFIPFYVCHSKEKGANGNTIEKPLDKCLEDCDNLITNINNSIGATAFNGFITKGKCFRYSVYPSYKANRKYDSLPIYLNDVKKYMVEKYNFYGLEGLEADDLVLSYKKYSKDDVIIVSPDKDILYLEGTHYNPRKNEFVTTTSNEAQIYFYKSMMVGDTADNIKGIKGIGPAYADKIIKNEKLFSSLRGTVLDKYCEIYGEEKGIINFYTNYRCLKILDNVDSTVFDNVKLNKIEVLSE